MAEYVYEETYRGVLIRQREPGGSYLFRYAGKSYGILAPLTYIHQYIDGLIGLGDVDDSISDTGETVLDEALNAILEAEEAGDLSRSEAWAEALKVLTAADAGLEYQILAQLYAGDMSLGEALDYVFGHAWEEQDGADSHLDDAQDDVTTDAGGSQDDADIWLNALEVVLGPAITGWLSDAGKILDDIRAEYVTMVEAQQQRSEELRDYMFGEAWTESDSMLEYVGRIMGATGGTAVAAIQGGLDFALELTDPLMVGLGEMGAGIVEGFTDILKIDAPTLLDLQEDLQREQIKRQFDLVERRGGAGVRP